MFNIIWIWFGVKILYSESFRFVYWAMCIIIPFNVCSWSTCLTKRFSCFYGRFRFSPFSLTFFQCLIFVLLRFWYFMVSIVSVTSMLHWILISFLPGQVRFIWLCVLRVDVDVMYWRIDKNLAHFIWVWSKIMSDLIILGLVICKVIFKVSLVRRHSFSRSSFCGV